MRKHDPATKPAKKQPTRGTKEQTQAERGAKAPSSSPRAGSAAATNKTGAKAPTVKKAASKKPVAGAPALKKSALEKTVARAPAAKKAPAEVATAPAAKKPPNKKAKPPAAKKAPKKKAVAKPSATSATAEAATKRPTKAATPTTSTAKRARAEQLELPIVQTQAASEPAKRKAASSSKATAESPLETLQRAAAAGDAKAQAHLGDLYYAGRTVAQDPTEAERWWTRAAAQGEPSAKESLASLYAEGEGEVAQDLGRALTLFRECAAAGLEVAELLAWAEARLAETTSVVDEPPLPSDEGEAVAALARRAGLERVAERVSALRRASIRLAAIGGAPVVGASKVGGAPDLPNGAAWPKSPSGKALAFVAQLDCAQSWPADLELRLPSEGLLSFFIDAGRTSGQAESEPRACAVLYGASHERFVTTKAASPPLPERAVDLAGEPTLPFPGASVLRELGLDEDELEGYVALHDELLPRLRRADTTPLARSLGHADLVRNTDTARSALDEASAMSTLLLQLDGSAAPSLLGTGALYVWIRDDDLAAHRFEKAFARVQR